MKIHAFQVKVPLMNKSDETSILYCFKSVSTNIRSYAVKSMNILKCTVDQKLFGITQLARQMKVLNRYLSL